MANWDLLVLRVSPGDGEVGFEVLMLWLRLEPKLNALDFCEDIFLCYLADFCCSIPVVICGLFE